MKTTGTCPKCGSRDIATDAHSKYQGSDRKKLSVGPTFEMWADAYLCLGCGYLEEFVDLSPRSWPSPTAKREAIGQHWTKVGGK
jgi:hypothetical protein